MNDSPNKSQIVKYGVRCLLNIMAIFAGVFFITVYITQIKSFISIALITACESLFSFFIFSLPASPTITAICIAVALWLVCMAEKLENSNLLSLNLNSNFIKSSYVTFLISFVFYVSFIVQSTSGITGLKMALLIGIIVQVLVLIEFQCIEDRLLRPRKKPLPLDL